MAVVLRIVLMRRNAHRRKIYNQAGVNPAAEVNIAICDGLLTIISRLRRLRTI